MPARGASDGRVQPSPRDAPLSARQQADLDGLIAAAATRGERLIAGTRIVLVVPALARSAYVWGEYDYPLLSPGPLGSLAVVTVLVAFSCFVLVRYRKGRRAPPRLLAISVTLDAVCCFLALLTNPLSPGPGYAGITRMPDPAALLILTMASALRLSVPVAVLGGALSLAALLALVLVDAALGLAGLAEVGVHVVSYSLLLLAGVVAAAVMARRARTIALDSASHTLRAERAEQGMLRVLRDQHDVRTLLSAANLNADLLRRGLQDDAPQSGDAEELRSIAGQLREDLDAVNEFVTSVKERSHGDLLSLQRAEPVDVGEVADRVIALLGPRFPDVALVRAGGGAGERAWTAGGALALQRIVLNLVVNACEGDGESGAGRVELRIARADDAVRLEVRDDGPGLPEAVLAEPAGGAVTTKAGGSGMGLSLVHGLVEASGGSVALGNPPGGGARIVVELPRLRAPD